MHPCVWRRVTRFAAIQVHCCIGARACIHVRTLALEQIALHFCLWDAFMQGHLRLFYGLSRFIPPPRPQVHLMEHNLHSQLFNLQVFICGELINCGPIYNNESRLSVWLWACWFYSRQILCLLWEGKSDRIFLPLSPHVANLKTIFFPSKFPISASLWRQFSGCPLRPLGALLTTPCWSGSREFTV